MLIRLTSSIILLLICGCTFAQQVAFTIHEPDLIPEGISYDAFRNAFLLTSLSKNKIVIVSKGTSRDFITPQQDGFEGGLGIKADNKRNLVWACSGSVRGKKFSTGIYVFDLMSGRQIKKYQIKSDNSQTFFNDLILDPFRGDAYITNTSDNSIWKWSAKDAAPVRLKLDKPMSYPNGIAWLSPTTLVIATADGLYTLDTETLNQRLLEAEPGVESRISLDGLVVYKNTIIGVSNASQKKTEHAIVQFVLSNDQRRIIESRVIDKNNPKFDIPTTMTLFENTLYVIANSQMEALQENGNINDRSTLKDVVVLQYDLK